MKQDLNKLMCLDLYLSAPSDHSKTITETPKKANNALPLINWDVFSNHYFKQLIASKKALNLRRLKVFAKKYQWKNDIQSIFDKIDFDSIVLTDKDQNIIWVDEGFSTMTGYSKKEALGKTPRFLQGFKTDNETTSKIALNLKKNKPFKTKILNYLKDSKPYHCEVHIFPMSQQETTHYLALEKEVL
ncbi:MAG: diguanylate cyclase [Flavobacteriaceae bacterium]|nr:diguanylate cyclase [Flavobacteriaceae bacterium]